MNDLFIKTMKKLQENRRIERNSKVLKEDKHVDLEGEEKDIVTVIDPDLSTKEFKEKQQEVNDIINNTPEGENVVDTEYVGMKIYTCPLCLSNFYSEVEMEDESQCPVCFETPDKFVYLGTVEQAASEDDEQAVEQAEQELDNSQPEEDNTDENEDEYELLDDEDNTDENEEDNENNELLDSKKLDAKGEIISESSELPEIHQKPNNSNKNYRKIDIYLDGKYFYSTKAFPTIKSAVENCKEEYGNEVKDRKIKGVFADRKNESLLTEGGIYPVDLDDLAVNEFENKVGELLGGKVSVSNLELIPAKGFGGSGIYWYKADINISNEDIIKQFLNDETPIAERLYDNNELIINTYSDIDVIASYDNYESGLTFDVNADTEISDEDYNKLDEEADIVGEQIINKLKENEQMLVNLLKDYEIIDDEDEYIEESLKSEDTGTIASDESDETLPLPTNDNIEDTETELEIAPEIETSEVNIPEIDIDDLCNSLQNSESINELGNIIIVIPDGEIKDNAKAAFDKCMDEYNFDTNYVANSITEAIHNITNKLVSEAKITDYMNQQELDKAIKSNSVLKNVVRSYQVLNDMIIEVTSDAGKSYYKAILNDDGEIELFWISKDGKKLGDSFPLLSEDCKKLNEEIEAEGFKYNNKEYTGLDTYTYTFTLDQEAEFEKAKEELAKTGTVTEIFINNGYGLEYKKDKEI